MRYSIILTGNDEYRRVLFKCRNREAVFTQFQKYKTKNKALFPKKFVVNGNVVPIKYKVCITKFGEDTDKHRTLRDDYGKTYTEKAIDGWTILDSIDYEIEETFNIFGLPNKGKRPTIADIIKRLMVGAYKKNAVKQVIVVYNKLLIYDEEHFELIICKCIQDAQRLHHTLAKICKKQKIKSLLFMGTASEATKTRLYELIQTKTGWSSKKIRRTTSRG